MFGIDGLLYIPNYVTADQHDRLVGAIDAQPWRLDLARRTQQYGYLYEHKARTADLSVRLGDLPDWLQKLARQMQCDGIVRGLPDQAIINEYEPGQGIGLHVDSVDHWEEVVTSLSLCSAAVMDLAREDALVPLLLEPRSLIVFRSEARYQWKHGMARRSQDVIEGSTLPRARRLSITMRQAKLTKEER